MSWKDAITKLAAVAVSGVTTSYDLDGVPDVLPAADLPALIPAFPEGSGPDDAPGLATLTYDGSAWRAGLTVEHVLYWTPAWSDAGLQAVLPDLLDAVDAYLEAISADGTLDETLGQPLEIERVAIGEMVYAGVTFYGARFRHRWMREVEAGVG